MTISTSGTPQQDEGTTSAASTSGTSATIDEAAVVSWLKQHPNFFQNQTELLLQLSIPHASGKAISLLERQVAVYRERLDSLQDQAHEFLQNAHENDTLFEKTRMVILDILRCNTLSALTEVIREKLSVEFAASASALVFVSANPPTPDVIRLMPVTVKAALGELYEKQRTYCGVLNSAQQLLLFASQTPAIISAAIVPLHVPENSAIRTDLGVPLLLIGSTEEKHFNSSLGTLFLDFIGEVLAVHLQTIYKPA
ncbi:MAG: DUF484 family protein [Pseudomonadota bacterium]